MRTIIFATTLSFLYLFSAAQNVGIGTTTPAVKLDILSPSQTGLRLLSGGINSNTSLEIGRTSANVSIGIAGINGDYSLGSQPGDVIIRTEDLSHRLILNNGAGNPAFTIFNGNVGIGTVTPASSAKVEINSTSQGFLPPRLTISQRNAISNPAIGLVIFCTDCDEVDFFNGIIWKNMAGSAACINPSLPNVTICNQVWMLKNLDIDHYRNGDLIPQVTDPTAWANLTTGAWCYYNNDAANGTIYGKLYNWYAVNDPRSLAPAGWHVASDADWTTLTTCLGGESVAGGKMKTTGTLEAYTGLWHNPNSGATNRSGFAGLPGGYFYSGDGTFSNIGYEVYWWSSTEWNASTAYVRYMSFNGTMVSKNAFPKSWAHYVRCVAD